MNKIKTMIQMLLASLLLMSCGKEEPAVEYLEVTSNNISGEWKLVEWRGSALQEDTYFYIDLVRKDKEFTIYQNFDSMGDMPHKVTGNFNIETDVEKGAIIRGIYDYDEGYWSHEYEVNELTEVSMIWVATDDPLFVQKFVRVDTIPEDIKGAE